MKTVKLTTEQKEAKEQAKELARIEAEKNQKEVKEITINIEWEKSRTWGTTPFCQAEVTFKDGSYQRSETFTASGCGYDKESTVISEVFNAYLKYKLYKNLPIGEVKSHVTSARDNGLPYGISTGKWNYYNGGIGTNCYKAIAEAIGGKFERIASGQTFDVFKYTDND